MRPTATISTSYLAGFNNRASIVAAAGLSFLVLLGTLWLFRNRPRIEPQWTDPSGRLRWTLVAPVIALTGLVLAICGFYVIHSGLRYIGDAGYIIEVASEYQETHRALYSQLEFAYGPLLLLPIVWISNLFHLPIATAYFATLVLHAGLGLFLLAFVLNELPIRAPLRKAAFLLFAFGAITPHLGLNYTLLRFVTPLAILLFAMRGESLLRSTLLLCGGEVLTLLLSPELGLAFSMGVLAFGIVRALGDWRWLFAAFLPVLTLALLLGTFGRPYLRMAAQFSRGTLNFPVGPYPQLLVFIFALVWLVPVALGRIIDLRTPGGARLAGAYLLSVSLLPAALGRPDPLHVFFNGTGILLLSLVGASLAPPRWRLAWILCVAVVPCWNQFVNQSLFAYRTVDVFRRTLLHHLSPAARQRCYRVMMFIDPQASKNMLEPFAADDHLDLPRLNALVGPDAPIATPLEIPLSIERELKASHHYSPEFFTFWVDMLNASTEQHSIRDVNHYHWMLLPPDEPGKDFYVYTPRYTFIFQYINMHYHQHNPVPYYPGKAFTANLHDHWVPVADFGQDTHYTLYRNTDPTPPQP